MCRAESVNLFRVNENYRVIVHFIYQRQLVSLPRVGELAVDLYITFAVKSKSHIGRLEMLLLPWLPTRGTRDKAE